MLCATWVTEVMFMRRSDEKTKWLFENVILLYLLDHLCRLENQ